MVFADSDLTAVYFFLLLEGNQADIQWLWQKPPEKNDGFHAQCRNNDGFFRFICRSA